MSLPETSIRLAILKFRLYVRSVSSTTVITGVSPLSPFSPVYLVPQCHQIMIGMNFFYFEFGYSVGGSLVFWFTIMYGLGTLISEASFAWLSSKFTRNQIITAATVITVIGYMLFMSVGYILPKSVVLLNIMVS